MFQIELFSLFLQIVSVIILMKLLNWSLIQPVLRIAEERASSVHGDTEATEKLLADAESRRNELSQKQADVRREVQNFHEKQTGKASDEARATLEEVSKRTDFEVEEALKTLNQDVENARPDLERRAGELAELIERKLIGLSLIHI